MPYDGSLTQAVSTEEGQALAKEYGINFFEASAKQDINVEKAFLYDVQPPIYTSH